jgi:hypothetical protein
METLILPKSTLSEIDKTIEVLLEKNVWKRL